MIDHDDDQMLHFLVGAFLLPESIEYSASAYAVIRRLLWQFDSVRSAIIEKRYDDAEEEIRRLLSGSQLQAVS